MSRNSSVAFCAQFRGDLIPGTPGINRHPANVPEKEKPKKEAERIDMGYVGSRLSSYRIESIKEGVNPCII